MDVGGDLFGVMFPGPHRLASSCLSSLGYAIESSNPEYGEHEALAIYQTHRMALLNYARRFTGDTGISEDIVQEAWLRFDRAMLEQAPVDPVGFLFRVVRNLAIDSGRRAGREKNVIQFDGGIMAEGSVSGAPAPEQTLVAREELQLLMAAIEELPERTKQAIRMRRFEGLKLKEIAARMEVSVPFVHQLIAEGLAYCRSRLSRD